MLTMKDRYLWLVRHAKTQTAGVSDQSRELNGRGRRQCAEIAARVANHEYFPQVVLVSSATRALTTAYEVFHKSEDTTIIESERLYTFNAHSLISAVSDEIVQHRLSHIEYLAVVGHNSAVSECVESLTQGREFLSLPTLGMAIVRLSGQWSELEEVQAVMIETMTPESR